MSRTDPVEQNIIGVQSLIGSKLNKVMNGAGDNQEGVKIGSDYVDELELNMSNEELIQWSDKLENKWRPYAGKILPRIEANKTWYLGKQNSEGPNAVQEGEPISANLLFEAEETFLPAALSKNPEPVVWADNTTEGNAISNSVKTMLQFHADILVLRRKLTLMTRKWSIDMLGVIKHGFDSSINEISLDVRDAKKFIFDPEGYVDVYGDFVGSLGERITVTGSRLIELYPKHKEFISAVCEGKLGTDCVYTEWWTDDYGFVTFKGMILDKYKNPHFKHAQMETQTDLDGVEEQNEVPGNNHFARPKKPYTFLSVFSLENQPFDETGLIEQNIPNQRRVTRRTNQIDYNLSRANNSDVFSEDNFNQETAKQASTALAKGHPVLIPQGRPINEAIVRLQAPQIGSDFFTELENSKNDLRSIFGTQGITATQQDEDQTARGMILNQQYDNSRIGGGIGDALEQVADNIFNWWVQMYYVYYDEPHFAAIMGQMKAVEYITLQASDFDRKLVVSVSPDSMKPHDEVTEMNQAISLYEMGVLDPKTLLTVLNFPDPQNTAAQAVLWKINPQLYMQLNFPELAQQIQATMPQPGTPGSPTPAGAPPAGGSEPASPPSPLGAGVPANPSLSTVPLPK